MADLCYPSAMSAVYRPPFPKIQRACYEARPNRFIVLCRLASGEVVRAFLPNPGRLQELLLPGVTVYLVPAAAAPERKTAFTMVGVEGRDRPIFLHTHVNNDVARHLLEQDRVPGLEGARILRAEAPLGHSRFDFLLESRGEAVYLEVKSCTLFGNGVAMFPDAVTERGRRHLEELAELSRRGTRTVVLFVIHSGQVRWFMPDYHTDPAFSRTLVEVRNDVEIIPLSVSWRRDFRLADAVRRVAIPWAHVAREIGDRGNFLALYRVDTPEGARYYLVTGWRAAALFSFLRGLQKAAERSGLCLLERYALVSSVDQQAAIARQVSRRYPGADAAVPAALALNPPCGVSRTDPRQDRDFHDLLATFRMAHPAQSGHVPK